MSFFRHKFEIAGRPVGEGDPVLIIAEAGVNHFGSLDKALSLVDLAASSGADVFKTQAFSTSHLVSSQSTEWRDRLRPKEVSFDFIQKTKQKCDEYGLIFLCTAHDDSVLPWLDELNVPAFKVGSGERGNTPFLRDIARRGKPVILSTGMYSMADVRETIKVFEEEGLRELALLHCVTSYPAPFDQVNLKAICSLMQNFSGPVGYSDHTVGHHVALSAVALGATIIEKHITLDFNVPNAQDWKVSCGPDDFPDLVREIREVEAALGDGEKIAQPCEFDSESWALKSLVAAKELKAGSVITEANVVAKRFGGGIAPNRIGQIIGLRLKRDVAADEKIQEQDLEG